MTTRTIEIEKSVLAKCNRALASETPVESGKEGKDVLWTFTAKLGNGYEADIKICNGQPPFIDPVLFKNGREVACLQVDSTRLEGEYIFDKNHTVIVKEKKP